MIVEVHQSMLCESMSKWHKRPVDPLIIFRSAKPVVFVCYLACAEMLPYVNTKSIRLFTNRSVTLDGCTPQNNCIRGVWNKCCQNNIRLHCNSIVTSFKTHNERTLIRRLYCYRGLHSMCGSQRVPTISKLYIILISNDITSNVHINYLSISKKAICRGCFKENLSYELLNNKGACLLINSLSRKKKRPII